MKIIIAGAGSVGTYLLERLAAEDHEIVAIDLDEEVLEQLSEEYEIRTIRGSASVLATLRTAGVADADIFIAATDSDETNLIACLLADSLNERIRKVARVRKIVTDESGLSERIAEVFDHFINPDFEAVAFLLRLFEMPGTVEVMEFSRGQIRVVGLHVEPDSPLVGHKLSELHLRFKSSQMLIAAINRDDKLIIPHGADHIQAGDEIYLAARADQLPALFESLGRTHTPVRFAIIYGGGGIGRRLAKELVARDVKVKLIDWDVERCAALANELEGVLILNGDAADQDLLRDEGIADVDVFIGATSDEEKNILSGLLAKRLGARTSAVVITRSSYLHLISEIGIDIVVSPHIAAASSILRFVRRGTVSSAFSTWDDSAEVLEIVATAGSKIVGVPLRELKLPAGVIVVSVDDQGEAKLPRGETVIAPGNHVVFFSTRAALAKLQTLVEGKRSRSLFLGAKS